MPVVERLGTGGLNTPFHGGAGTARADAAIADDPARIDAQLRTPSVDANRDNANVMTRHVAALYVDPAGVYGGLPNVDVWGEDRDARLYEGPFPVVAHPPCKVWSIMGQCRPEIARGEDGGCFKAALEAVRRFGGVLEHPAYTRAWAAFNLPRPLRRGWHGTLLDEGLTCEVDQAWYGHPANKKTWLYYVGRGPLELRWGEAPPTGRTVRNDGGGGRDQRGKTPPAFRDVLLVMAATATA